MSENETAPVEEGDEHVVEIEDTGEEGDGIAYVEGFVILVPGGSTGQRLRIEIEDVEENFALASVIEEERLH